jgi:predicted permease
MSVHPPSILAILVSAASLFVLGAVWYSPVLFGPAWQRLVGLKDDELKRGFGRTLAISFVLALVATTNLGFFLGGDATTSFGVAAGAAAGLGWVATGLATSYLFARRPVRLILIDAGYHVVAYPIAGLLLTVVP